MEKLVPATLIVCGTFLIALPRIEGIIGMNQVATTMAALQRGVDLSNNTSGSSNLLLMAIGAVMILVGSYDGLRRRTE
jgi:hypothetical protein